MIPKKKIVGRDIRGRPILECGHYSDTLGTDELECLKCVDGLDPDFLMQNGKPIDVYPKIKDGKVIL